MKTFIFTTKPERKLKRGFLWSSYMMKVPTEDPVDLLSSRIDFYPIGDPLSFGAARIGSYDFSASEMAEEHASAKDAFEIDILELVRGETIKTKNLGYCDAMRWSIEGSARCYNEGLVVTPRGSVK
uniref:Uncharacterized protein n=1 Tax=Solanum tuberosum TaxID=4113 RepID=M1DKZ7_SOLTU